MREASAIAAWDEVADLYGHGSSPFPQFAERLARWADVTDGERVLDLGCGNGFGLRELLRTRPARAPVGIDFSAEMLRACRRRLASAPARVALARADVEALPLRAGSFDVAMASSVFQFIGYAPSALAEWRRVVRDGGRLVLSFPAGLHRDTSDVNVTLMTQFFGRLPADAQERLRRMPRAAGLPDLDEACRAAGFDEVEATAVEFETTVASRDEWWELQWTHGFRGFLREFDLATLAEMKARAFELLEPRCTPAGRVVGTQVFRFCRAR